MTNKLKTFSARERNMYFLGMTGETILYTIIGSCLAYYLQFTILIPAITVSIIMAVARVWDAFNDPMMGTIVDKTRTKIGKCQPYLLAAPVPIFITTVLCFVNLGFYNPAMGLLEGKNALIVLWAIFTYLLWEMTFTIGDIPLWGITALMSEDEKDRTKLLSYARIASMIGGGIALLTVQPVALALGKRFTPLFTATAKVSSEAAGERLGFIVAAIVFGVVGCVLFQLTGIFVRERIPVSKKSRTLKENFALMWKNKPFRQILLSGILGSPKYLLGLTIIPLITYYYSNKDSKTFIFYMALWGGGMFVGQFMAVGIVPKLVKKFSKKDVYNFINLLSIIPFVSLFALYVSAPTKLVEPFYLIICLVLFMAGGAVNGFSTVLQSIMIADAVDYEEYCSGIRPDGVFFSGLTFIGKLCIGIAVIISGIAYSIVGFSDVKVAEVNAFIARGGIPRLESKYDAYMMVLFFLVSIPPAIGGLLAVIPTWKYCLSNEEHGRILAELNVRRHSDDKEENAGEQ
ncbi:MAG: MFS transporter [Eubacteriales bacterium]